MTILCCPFPPGDILKWAAHYGEISVDEEVVRLGRAARERGWMTLEEFTVIGDWKSPRSRKWRALNDAASVENATRAALESKNERVRIGVLMTLEGVGWPTASVLPHLMHPDPYPILDIRALETLGVIGAPKYRFDLWWSYTGLCRQLATDSGHDMRTVDRALWGFSKAHGSPAS